MSTEVRQLDTIELKERVQRMYEEVALEPDREFHFETGRPLATCDSSPSSPHDSRKPSPVESERLV